MQDSWTEVASAVLQENTAQAIHQQLEQLDNQKDQYSRRWIWELFQNAVDAVSAHQRATIRIRHSGNKFFFSHNGAPFQQKELLHLIFHGSTKREREGVIGRYGTGFLTTHVLSKTVRISGRLTTSQEFNFVLDRTGSTPSEIDESISGSFNNLKRSIRDCAGDETVPTVFEYDLDNISSEYVREALRDLRIIAPLVLAFNPTIGSIEIEADDILSLSIVAKHQDPQLGSANIIEVGNTNTNVVEWRCCLISGDNVSIAIPLEDRDGKHTCALNGGLPRLFVAFPLFGSEDLPLPFIINCLGKPTEKRNGLFLGQEQTEDNLQNKAHVEVGWSLFKEVLEYAANAEWEGLFELARVGPAAAHDWLDGSWFNQVTTSHLLNDIVTASLVRTSESTSVSPQQAIFPLPPLETDSDQFLALLKPAYGSQHLPVQQVASEWIDVLNRWSGLISLHDLKIRTVSLVDLSQRISAFKSLEALQGELNVEPATHKAIGWLNEVFSVVLGSANQDILDKERVLPDQNGVFQLRSHLKRDSNIDEKLKEISKELGNDIRGELLNVDIAVPVQELLPPMTSDEVSAFLLSRIVSKTKTEYGTPAYRRASSALFGWFASDRRIDSLKAFPFISAETDQSGNEKPAGSREQLLAPVRVWPTTAQPFPDLFPSAYIASNLYADVIDGLTWDWLQDQGFFLLDPVVRRFQDVDGDDLIGLLEEPLTRDQEDLDHRISSMEVLDLTHLTLKDKGLIDGVRNSKPKCVRFLEFIVRHILPTNSAFLNYQVKECGCARTHSLHSALWVSVLKNRQWVYERKGHSARPTAANLAKIWKESSELMPSVARTEVILFLRRLEVNASEIQRATSSTSESESLEMEKAMVALLAATNNDSDSLQVLADIASSEPDLFAEYKERLKQRERIRLNQKVGASIEALFKLVFSDPKFLKLGLRITRTGWGSDFCFEHDFIDENGEVAFELRGNEGKTFLIELKSTTGETVSVSEMQGSEAVARPSSFALCVVPLEQGEIGAEMLKKNSRFVPSIGKILSKAVSDLNNLRAVETRVATSGSEVDVLIDESDVVYRVKAAVWERGLRFDEFIDFLLRFFRVPSSEA